MRYISKEREHWCSNGACSRGYSNHRIATTLDEMRCLNGGAVGSCNVVAPTALGRSRQVLCASLVAAWLPGFRWTSSPGCTSAGRHAVLDGMTEPAQNNGSACKSPRTGHVLPQRDFTLLSVMLCKLWHSRSPRTGAHARPCPPCHASESVSW